MDLSYVRLTRFLQVANRELKCEKITSQLAQLQTGLKNRFPERSFTVFLNVFFSLRSLHITS
uniref:Uncharacterized protein n=1 Tax=Anguilla anguilla TaxID=7936 RepID=A0A0E9SR36_ANGAN